MLKYAKFKLNWMTFLFISSLMVQAYKIGLHDLGKKLNCDYWDQYCNMRYDKDENIEEFTLN